MKRKLIAMAVAVFGFATGAQADEMIALKAGYMMLTPSGTFSAPLNNIGTSLDMKKDLNLKNSTQAFGEVTINLGDSSFLIGFTPMSYSGSSTLTGAINFNGQAYTAGTATTSEFKADIVDVGYTYYLINMDDLPSRLQLGFETAVKIISAKSSITGGGITSNKNVTVPIPTVGLRGRVALADFIGVSARLGYLGYSGNSFTDADAQIEFSPVPTLGIFGGYRYINLKLNATGLNADMKLKGPFAGAFFRF